MLVQPGFGGTRQGYRSAKAQESKQKSAQEYKASTTQQQRDDDRRIFQQQTITRPSGGIPAADILEEVARRKGFQLIDPKKRQLFAEVINFQNLPQGEEEFNPSFKGITGGPQLEEKYKKSGATTKADFANIIQSGSLGVGTQALFNKNVDDLFKGVDLSKSFSPFDV